MASSNKERIRKDQAGVGPHTANDVRLVRLGKLDDVKIADGEPDIRGWDVRTVSGRQIGKVDDLLIDAARGEVVMLEIDLDDSDRHTLAPIRAAQLDRERKIVLIDSGELQGEELPTLGRRGPLSDDDARAFGERYDRAYGDRGWDRDRNYRLERDDEELSFGRRSLDTAASEASALGSAGAGDAAARRREVRVEEWPAEEGASRVPAPERDRDRGEVRYARGEDDARGDQGRASEGRPAREEVVIRRRVLDPARRPAEPRDFERQLLDRDPLDLKPPNDTRR